MSRLKLKYLILSLVSGLLVQCQAPSLRKEETTPAAPKFAEKEKTLTETITISEPGVYDYQKTMHIWKGDGGCDLFSTKPAVMEIYSDNVTIKNFGFKNAIYGIRIRDDDHHFKNVRIENIEGHACFAPLALPDSGDGITVIDALLYTEDRIGYPH